MKPHEEGAGGTKRGSRLALPWSSYAVRLALELVIVFAGVYMASSFAKFQESRANEARRHQIRQALIREIEDITAHTRDAAQAVGKSLAEYDTLIKLKRMPPLHPYLEPVRFESHVWQSTLQSGGLELFDPATVYGLSEFYNVLNDGFEQLQQMRRLSEQLLLPRLDAGSGEFYDVNTGKLRPKYRWYFSTLREVGGAARNITLRGDSLVARLCRDDGGCSSAKASGK